MKLTKANCVFALAGLYSAADGEHDEENVKVIQQLIDEHFELVEVNKKLRETISLMARENKALADDNEMKCELNDKLSKEVAELKKNDENIQMKEGVFD